MTYYSRFNASSVIKGQIGASSILKEKADIMGEKDFLLGKNQVVKDTEAKTKMHNAGRRKKKGVKAQPQASTTPQMPFQGALQINKDREAVVKGAELATNLFIEKKGNRLNPKEKVSVITNSFLNSLEFSVLIPDSALQNVHPFIKNLFQGTKIPQVPLAGRLKYFLKSWEKLTRDPNILSITQGFQILFKRKPSQKSKI